MDLDESQLSRFDLLFPGHLLEGYSRDLAIKVRMILGLVESAFFEAAVALLHYRPVDLEDIKSLIEKPPSSHEQCLNRIYAKAYVYSLDAINKLLDKLKREPSIPELVISLCEDYLTRFGSIRHVRNSAMHREDRGLGLRRNQERINTRMVILEGFNNNNFCCTGEDGVIYEMELSESILSEAHRILQAIINAFDWVPMPQIPTFPEE